MPPPSLRYAITDRHLLPTHQSEPEYPAPPAPKVSAPPPLQPAPAAPAASFIRLAQHLQQSAVPLLQLREKDLPPADLRAVAHALRHALPPGTAPRLLLNLGHQTLSPEALLTLALEAHFDGLHLPSSIPPSLATHARARFASAGLPPPFLSASVHTPAEIVAILPARPDLLLFGPVFGKVVHGTAVLPALGLPALAAAVRLAHPTPVLALGGVTPANTPSALATGAAGIASIRLFLPRFPSALA